MPFGAAVKGEPSTGPALVELNLSRGLSERGVSSLFGAMPGTGFARQSFSERLVSSITLPGEFPVEDQFALAYGYPVTVTNPAFNPALPVDPITNPQTIPNPQSKAAFMNKQLTRYIKDIVKSSQVQAAAATAAASAATSADTELP